MSFDKITPDMLWAFLLVALALVGSILLVWQLVDKVRGASKPAREMAQWRANTDRRIKDTEECQRVTLRGINALISHEINGNSIDKLRTSHDEIVNYLIDR